MVVRGVQQPNDYYCLGYTSRWWWWFLEERLQFLSLLLHAHLAPFANRKRIKESPLVVKWWYMRVWLIERVLPSAWMSSLYIECESHRVSNCRVRACINLDFCTSISSFGSSDTSFYSFFELEFSRVWNLRVNARRVSEFRVAHSSTSTS